MSILEVKDIHKSFGKTSVLNGVSFSMEKGEVISILGSSGSGKTTLLRCINFLTKPDSGQIFLDGELLYDASLPQPSSSEMRQKQLNFGLVFQDFNLFPQYSVIDNVTLAPKLHAKKSPDFKAKKKEIYAEIEENAIAILNRVGLGDKLQNYPCELSGGQKQRVSIARALILKPRVLFFDEPTSALDPELTGEILRVIRKLAEEHITMIIVTHEIDFAYGVSDKIIFMDGGSISEYGTPDEVINNPKNPRTKAFLTDFARALTLADKVVLADIYAAREKNTIGISSKDLQAEVAKLGKECYYFHSFDEIENFLLKNCINGDLLITMGAGDVVKIGENLLGM